jgi:NMD protein affecting ribosome stability and mRNA decay
MQTIICKKCGKEIDVLECFSGQICVDCYEEEYEKMSEEEKRPDFTKVFSK